MSEFEFTLPHGVNLRGEWTRTGRLAPLTGADEAFLIEQGSQLLPAQRTTALLANCVTHLGQETRITPEHIRALTIGDREALLLNLHRLTFGETLDCVIRCPNPTCGEKMELDLRVSELLHAPYADAGEVYEIEGKDKPAWRASFRLPTGEDQENAAVLARNDTEEAERLILTRCLISASTDAPMQSLLRELPEVMAELDPQAETTLRLTCPVCETAFAQVLDAGDFLFREITDRETSLYRQVHLLAYHYHWGEGEIMALTDHKRHMYLGLLREQLGAAR